MKIRRDSAVAMAPWSISIEPRILSASAAHPSFFASLIVWSLCELTSIRFFSLSTWSPDKRSWRKNKSRVAMYKSLWFFRASRLVVSACRTCGQPVD